MEEITRFTRTFIFTLFLAGAAALLLPIDYAQAGQNGNECPGSALDLGMPEIEPQYSLPEEYDKENLFTDTIETFKSGESFFRLEGFVSNGTGINQPEAEISFSTDRDSVVLKSEAAEYQPDSLDKGDILKAIPSISTEDDKTLGILVPPFAYFSKKF